MTPPEVPYSRPPRSRSASPADRGAEFAETQRRLKREAAERRQKAAERTVDARPARRAASSKSRGRG